MRIQTLISHRGNNIDGPLDGPNSLTSHVAPSLLIDLSVKLPQENQRRSIFGRQ